MEGGGVADDAAGGVERAGEAAGEDGVGAEGSEEAGALLESGAALIEERGGAGVEAFGGHGEGGGAFGEDAVGAACGETLGEIAEGGEARG